MGFQKVHWYSYTIKISRIFIDIHSNTVMTITTKSESIPMDSSVPTGRKIAMIIFIMLNYLIPTANILQVNA